MSKFNPGYWKLKSVKYATFAIFGDRFQEGGGGWQGWVWPGGAVQSLSLGVVNGIPYLAGRDSSGALWWYTESSGWVGYGQGVFAGGAVAATPR